MRLTTTALTILKRLGLSAENSCSKAIQKQSHDLEDHIKELDKIKERIKQLKSLKF